ncbi:hypothetical protein ACFLUV_04615 [Elusimicrobiota bacterium]
MKRIINCIFIIVFICSSVFAAEIPKVMSGSRMTVPLKGKVIKAPKPVAKPDVGFFGEEPPDIPDEDPLDEIFEVRIDYTDYYFVTGDGLAGYYIGYPMRCEVVITNNGSEDYTNLTVTMAHEYYESGLCDRWWKKPSPVEFEKGEQLPGDSAMVWPEVNIKKGETKVLLFQYKCPYETCSGLDQTHVIIEDRKEDAVLELFNDSEAGVFCPPPPPE